MAYNPKSHLRGGLAAAALSLTLSACGGGGTAVTPLAPPAAGGAAIGASRDAAFSLSSLAPAPTSTEFFTGITPNSEPHGIALGPSGNLWFTQANANEIGRITPTGAVTEYSGLTTSANNIVKGSDGNMWFTAATTDAIGRITGGGKIKEFQVGTAAFGPWDITSGADGNLWFTLRSPDGTGGYINAIGRMTTRGAVTLFTNGLTPGDIALHDITTGPDGNVWFIEEFGNRVGRITPAGVITEFSMGISPGANLVDITAGPDRNLWFTEYGINSIGRITPSGVVTEFSKGISPGAGPGSIARSSNAVWFTELGQSKIGRIQANGSIKEFAVPSTLSADIVAGPPAGHLWITDYSGNGIVRFTP
jgi:streptogramin lyase